MSIYCSVRGCISKKENKNEINFFRFPTKSKQREQWLKALNMLPLQSTINSFVCSKHFEVKYFVINNGNQILLPGAVPTIFFKNTSRNLIHIQPKPGPIFHTNQNILFEHIPIVVVPLQTGNSSMPSSNIINGCSILKANVNQNTTQLQTEIVETNDQTEINSFLDSVPISETIVEINNCEEENDNDSEETESVISINCDNENDSTQNSVKLDESCYVLVEVNDKKDGNLNTQDDAKIVASGFNIKELINDAKIAMNKEFQGHEIPTKKKMKRWRTNYIGDCEFEDMENPEIRKHHWTLALNEIQKLRRKVKSLDQKNRRLQKRLNNAKSVISQSKQKDNFQIESDDSS